MRIRKILIDKPKGMSAEEALIEANKILMQHCDHLFLTEVEIEVERVYRTRFDCFTGQLKAA